MILTTEIAEKVRDFATRTRRLGPSHRDPETFHIDKSELANDMERFAASLTSRQPVEAKTIIKRSR